MPSPLPTAMDSRQPLVLINGETARFECTFGRGCDGICCSNGTPPVDAEKQQRINDIMPELLPLLRPGARAMIENTGYLDRNGEPDENPTIRVEDDWCVFFNKGCVLHTVGQARGDAAWAKPAACFLFPLEKNENGEWYVRQHGYDGEEWDLFCLAGKPETPLAVSTLALEIDLATRIEAAEAAETDQPG
ncbi:MAG: DUF3109 family protein [Planctomycetota bacterium]|nr:DUF3109 family protein [Planctomycetota bacterium]